MSDETPETLLKSALERIVYFEARSSQLAHDAERAASDVERLKAELSRATQRELELKRAVAELEVRASRAEAARDEAASLADALKREKAGLLANLLDAARIHEGEGVDGFDLAQFIAQLRDEVLQVRANAAPLESAPAAKVEARIPPRGTPATRMAHELKAKGRLSVSEADVDALARGAAFPESDETLLGFSLRELGSSDVACRVRASERLEGLGQPAAASALVGALNVESEPVAQVAMVKALAALAGPEAAAVVKPLVAAPAAEVRIAALKALLRLDAASAGPHVLAAMSDPEPTVRRRASLLALGLETSAALALGTAALRDGNADVRALGALVLGASQASAARPLLLEAMGDADVKVRRSASRALSTLLGRDVSGVVGLGDVHRRREVRRLVTVEPLPVASQAPAPLPPREGPRRVPAAAAHGLASPSAALPTAPGRVAVLEATTERVLLELRTSLRGKSLAELAQQSALSPDELQGALKQLLSRGAVVCRGLKYFVA